MLNQLLEPVVSWDQQDLMQTTGRIVAMWETTVGFRRPKQILVDAIGYGAGVADRLKEQGLPAVAINVAEKPGIFDRYLRQRDELWFRAREWFQNRDVVICADDVLAGELSSIHYTFTSSGKIVVESKDDMKKRGLRSPDLADAFVLTFAASSKFDRGFSESRHRADDGQRPARTNSGKFSPFKWRR